MSLVTKAKYWIRQFPYIYPSKIIYSCHDWIIANSKRKGLYYSQRGPWFKAIFPESFLQNKAPHTVGSVHEKAFYPNVAYRIESSSLFYLQNSYLFGHKGLVLTINHQVFQEFTHHFNVSTLKKFLWKNPFFIISKSVKKIEGTGAVLVSPESHNYYHWLNDVLPRIRLYESVLDKIDHFCISSKVPAKFLEILAYFNIPKEKIILVHEKEKLHFDHLYVTSLPGSEGRSPQWAVDYLREKLSRDTKAAQPTDKIYFKRGNTPERKALNEDAIIKMLENDGFKIIDPDGLTIPQQVKVMQQAKIVIGIHGAALSNLAFCPAGTTVIEIFSPDYFRTDCYYTLSAMLNLNYWYIVGDKAASANWGDIEIPQELLLKTIKHIYGS